MQMATNCATKQNKIILLYIILLVFGILVVFLLNIKCPIKAITNIPCPGCGLTRAFRAIFNLDFPKAIKYNVLAPFIFTFFLISIILILIDKTKKTNYLENFLKKLAKNYKKILIFLLISYIINLIIYYYL